MLNSIKFPQEIVKVLKKLNQAGFEVFIVGGCVRDLLMGTEPKDWDITTNAKPEEIQKIFPDNFYDNNFETVTIITKNKKESLNQIDQIIQLELKIFIIFSRLIIMRVSYSGYYATLPRSRQGFDSPYPLPSIKLRASNDFFESFYHL